MNRDESKAFEDALRNLALHLDDPKRHHLTSYDLHQLEHVDSYFSNMFDSVHNQQLWISGKNVRKAGTDCLWQYPGSFGLAVILSFSPDGYVREAAVQSLIRFKDRGLPYLLLRSCDWVCAVREPTNAAQSLIPSASDQALAKCIQTLPAFAASGRLASTVWKTLIEELQRRPNLLGLIRKTAPAAISAGLIDHGWIGADENRTEILREGLRQRNGKIAQAALRQVDRLPTSVSQALLPELLTHRLRPARLVALKIVEELDLHEPFLTLLDDASPFIRFSARFALKKTGWTDFTQHYRERLPALSAIAGFAEVAHYPDIPELAPLLNHPSTRVRAKVLAAVGATETHSLAPAAAQCLGDNSPRVVRAAINALSRLAYALTDDDLAPILAGTANQHLQDVRNGVLRLFRGWQLVEVALDLSSRGFYTDNLDPMLSPRAGRFARPKPSSEQAKRIAELLAVAPPNVSDRLIVALMKELAGRRQ